MFSSIRNCEAILLGEISSSVVVIRDCCSCSKYWFLVQWKFGSFLRMDTWTLYYRSIMRCQANRHAATLVKFLLQAEEKMGVVVLEPSAAIVETTAFLSVLVGCSIRFDQGCSMLQHARLAVNLHGINIPCTPTYWPTQLPTSWYCRAFGLVVVWTELWGPSSQLMTDRMVLPLGCKWLGVLRK